jgi:hypothetical protein
MTRRFCSALLAGIMVAGLWQAGASTARAENTTMQRFWYYPYYYFPANYWPQQGPRWPEPPGAHYMRPPAYMSYPAFHEPNWRYDFWRPARYYRGFHFWLDQF